MYDEKLELFNYIMVYHHHLITIEEWSTYRFYNCSKIENYKTKMIIDDILTKVDKSIIDINLSEGVDKFIEKTLERLYEPIKYLDINRCPKCSKIARTNKAKQCRFCGNNWH